MDVSKIKLSNTEYNIKDTVAREYHDKSVEDILSYGVEWTVDSLATTPTRIGNMTLHKSLPIQSNYKGCVYNTTTKTVVYWLDPTDWSKKADGTDSDLSGTDGDVMVHIPRFYGKSGTTSGKNWVRISVVKIDDSWVEIPEMYVSAYQFTVSDNAARSVVNTTADFRGGSNSATNDSAETGKSMLGKQRTAITRATARNYAKNANAELLCYEFYKWIFYWNYVIEYANFNCQAAYNASLDTSGFHQGGLGAGVTTWDWTNWNNYNGNYPIIPLGYCNELGNGTGLKDFTTTSLSKTFSVPRWRGFDNPFGHIWTNLDGIIIQGDAAGNPKKVYTTTNADYFGDTDTEKALMTVAGEEIHADGYIREFNIGETGEIIPKSVGADGTSGKCDYHWTGDKNTSLRTLLVGGAVAFGALAGFGNFYSSNGVGNSNAIVGFRFVVREN